MINSLSHKAHEKLKHMSETLLASFVYDNFDMDFKTWMPTVKKPGSMMTHATSVFAFPLAHGVLPDDLKCSAELWATNPNNLGIEDQAKHPQHLWMHAVQAIHRPVTPAASMSFTDTLLSIPVRNPIIQQLAWHFQSTLVTFSALFKLMQEKLGMPKSQL